VKGIEVDPGGGSILPASAERQVDTEARQIDPDALGLPPDRDCIRRPWQRVGGSFLFKEEAPMHVGVAMFCTDYAIAPTELARALEERGFESLWLPEHSHIPLTRVSPFPQGGELPKKYFDVMDPFVVLGAAAAVTTRLKIATGICLVAQRDPIQTAKAVASIDQISKGRFLFGVGAGWNADEMADHGTEFRDRTKVLRERIEAMRAIWTQTKPEYAGEFVKFGPMMTWPKPVQKPHPPVLMGGGLPHGARRALAYADAWMPHVRRPTYHLLDKLAEFREMEKIAGRTLPITAWGVEHDADRWGAYHDAGMERIVLSINSETAQQVLPQLDRWAAKLPTVR
jgi:probable F420-dependent oxidoreductase